MLPLLVVNGCDTCAVADPPLNERIYWTSGRSYRRATRRWSHDGDMHKIQLTKSTLQHATRATELCLPPISLLLSSVSSSSRSIRVAEDARNLSRERKLTVRTATMVSTRALARRLPLAAARALLLASLCAVGARAEDEPSPCEQIAGPETVYATFWCAAARRRVGRRAPSSLTASSHGFLAACSNSSRRGPHCSARPAATAPPFAGSLIPSVWSAPPTRAARGACRRCNAST